MWRNSAIARENVSFVHSLRLKLRDLRILALVLYYYISLIYILYILCVCTLKAGFGAVLKSLMKKNFCAEKLLRTKYV